MQYDTKFGRLENSYWKECLIQPLQNRTYSNMRLIEIIKRSE